MKRFLLIFVILSLSLSLLLFVACDVLSSTPGNEDSANYGIATVYAYAQEAGFTGTLEELIAAFKGESGKSAYDLAVENGYSGTVNDWLATLIGSSGKNGITPHIGSNGNWFIGEMDSGVKAAGDNGVGITGIDKTGTQGLVDTYTITLSDGQTYTFTVTNGLLP